MDKIDTQQATYGTTTSRAAVMTLGLSEEDWAQLPRSLCSHLPCSSWKPSVESRRSKGDVHCHGHWGWWGWWWRRIRQRSQSWTRCCSLSDALWWPQHSSPGSSVTLSRQRPETNGYYQLIWLFSWLIKLFSLWNIKKKETPSHFLKAVWRLQFVRTLRSNNYATLTEQQRPLQPHMEIHSVMGFSVILWLSSSSHWTERWILPMILCFLDQKSCCCNKSTELFRLLHILTVSCWILEINFNFWGFLTDHQFSFTPQLTGAESDSVKLWFCHFFSQEIEPTQSYRVMSGNEVRKLSPDSQSLKHQTGFNQAAVWRFKSCHSVALTIYWSNVTRQSSCLMS